MILSLSLALFIHMYRKMIESFADFKDLENIVLTYLYTDNFQYNLTFTTRANWKILGIPGNFHVAFMQKKNQLSSNFVGSETPKKACIFEQHPLLCID